MLRKILWRFPQKKKLLFLMNLNDCQSVLYLN